jgi:hypothetical protein
MMLHRDRSACVPRAKVTPCDVDFVGRVAAPPAQRHLQGQPLAMTGVWRWRGREYGASARLDMRGGNLPIGCLARAGA